MPRPEHPQIADRNGAIWRAYVAGATQEAIAADHGISRQRVGQVLARIRESIPEPDRSQLVQREVEFLDELRRQALDLVGRPPIPAYSNGKPILMPPGPDGTQEIAEDHSGRLAALDRALRAHERLSKLLGLDAAAKVDATVRTSPDDIELVQRIRAWRAGQDADTEGEAGDVDAGEPGAADGT